MKVGFGKHKDESVETLVLKEPGYVAWALFEASPSGPLSRVKAEAQRLIAIFDSKPFLRKCCGAGCTKPASRCVVYVDNVKHPTWWCDDCDPYQRGASAGKLTAIRTYKDALTLCDLVCPTGAARKTLVRTMAQEKGLPNRVGKKEAEEFFSS